MILAVWLRERSEAKASCSSRGRACGRPRRPMRPSCPFELAAPKRAAGQRSATARFANTSSLRRRAPWSHWQALGPRHRFRCARRISRSPATAFARAKRGRGLVGENDDPFCQARRSRKPSASPSGARRFPGPQCRGVRTGLLRSTRISKLSRLRGRAREGARDRPPRSRLRPRRPTRARLEPIAGAPPRLDRRRRDHRDVPLHHGARLRQSRGGLRGPIGELAGGLECRNRSMRLEGPHSGLERQLPSGHLGPGAATQLC
jgi:hypothetical protein